jgi:ankyrin repeat protein
MCVCDVGMCAFAKLTKLKHLARGGSGTRALHFAAGLGHIKLVATLVELAADVDARGVRGARPLHAAAHHGQVEVVATLVEVGADVEARADGGLSPLHAAAHHGQVEVVATLVELGRTWTLGMPTNEARCI